MGSLLEDGVWTEREGILNEESKVRWEGRADPGPNGPGFVPHLRVFGLVTF
jgi:hypothetical protein